MKDTNASTGAGTLKRAKPHVPIRPLAQPNQTRVADASNPAKLRKINQLNKVQLEISL